MREQIERLSRLATELLDLSRLEAGSLELRPEPTDVHQLARDVAGEFTPLAAQRGSELRVQLAGEAIEIECDPERVAQVVRILIDNALMHTPTGTGVVVSAARENGQVTLEVSDSGLGIRRQTMPHIFEPFFTSDDRAQGAGLGLAIARELAERMSGELSVRSVPGRPPSRSSSRHEAARGTARVRVPRRVRRRRLRSDDDGDSGQTKTTTTRVEVLEDVPAAEGERRRASTRGRSTATRRRAS